MLEHLRGRLETIAAVRFGIFTRHFRDHGPTASHTDYIFGAALQGVQGVEYFKRRNSAIEAWLQATKPA